MTRVRRSRVVPSTLDTCPQWSTTPVRSLSTENGEGSLGPVCSPLVVRSDPDRSRPGFDATLASSSPLTRPRRVVKGPRLSALSKGSVSSKDFPDSNLTQNLEVPDLEVVDPSQKRVSRPKKYQTFIYQVPGDRRNTTTSAPPSLPCHTRTGEERKGTDLGRSLQTRIRSGGSKRARTILWSGEGSPRGDVDDRPLFTYK